MVNAKFMYREFTPRGVMPSDMTALQFFGEEEMTAPLTALKGLVQYDRLRLSDYEMGVINSIRNDAGQDINVVMQQKFANRLEELEEENLYTPKELTDKFSSLLQTLGFVCDNVEVNERGIAKAVYSSSMPDAELMKMVETMIAELQGRLEAKKLEVLARYDMLPANTVEQESAEVASTNDEEATL